MKIVFVDGYNVLNSWPDLKEEKEYSFEGSREKLIAVMHNYSAFNDCKVIIVFDAHKVAGSLEKKDKLDKNLSVIFTKDGETADSYIERSVHEIGRKYEVYVVTSDSLEQQTIFQRGAVRISSLEFYNEVIETEDIIRNKAEKSKIPHKNHLQDNINFDVLRKLEEIRRSQ